MTQQMQDVLVRCIERLSAGDRVENCLRDYPEQASELKPLLQTTIAVRRSCSAIKPRAEYKAKVYDYLEQLYCDRQARKGRGWSFFAWHKHWAVAMIAVVMVLFSGMGIVVASSGALPGESLYTIKLVTEKVKLATSVSDMHKAKLHIQFAERRADEIARLVREGKTESIPALTDEIGNQLNCVIFGSRAMKNFQAGDSQLPSTESSWMGSAEESEVTEIIELLHQSRERSLHELNDALSQSSLTALPSLEQAIRDTSQAYDDTLLILEGD